MADDKKKYNAMENILQNINSRYISLPGNEITLTNAILKEIIDLIINKMKLKDALFKEMYTRVFFGGSYYDGLKVAHPDEFDLDLLLSLPKLVEPTLTTSNVPGYVHLQLKEWIKFMKQSELVARYKGLDKLIDDKQYLDTAKVLRWMESVVTLAINDFGKSGSQYIFNTTHGTFYAKMCKGGPAFTLKVNGIVNGKQKILDVDLVPCFVFGKEKWPVNGFRANPITQKSEFFIVPKPLKIATAGNSSRYWRLSFQEQERVLIDGKKTLKPTIKLLKKLRDTQNHKCIASYYIKTVVLWQAFEQKNDEFWNNSLSYVFMTVLKEYQNCLASGKLRYFWNKNNNLIGNISKDTLLNISQRIKYMIDDIEKNPALVAKYL